MAVVGEARIIVRAITDGVASDITRALREAQGGVDKEGNVLGKKMSEGINKGFGKNAAFQKLADEARSAREAFSGLQRKGYYVQTALGVLAGTIGSLVGAIGGLVGALGAAAPSLVAFGGAAIGMGLGMKLASLALKGVTGPLAQVNKQAGATGKTVKQLREEMQQLKFDSEDAALGEKEASLNLEKARETLARVQDMPPNSMARREAELAYEQADLAMRRAIDRNNDLKEQIAKGPTQKNAGPDPYAGLTKSQKAFAKLLVGLKPKFDALKEAVAKGFLPDLGKAINSVMTDAFPTLIKGFGEIGTALGHVSTKLGKVFTDAAKSGTLGNLFTTSSVVLEKLGDALSKVFGSVLTILEAASPVTITFVGWIDDMATKFSKFIDKSSKNNKLQKFFEDSAGFAKDFGTIFGNIWTGIQTLIEEAFKPGSGAHILIDWIKNATAGFANMGADGKLGKFLTDTANNTTAMLDVFKDFGGILTDLGADPNVGIFWKTVGKGVPLLKKILEDGSKAGPKLGELLYQATRVVAAFSDNKTLETFFDTLVNMAKAVADFFNRADVKRIVDSMSQIHGFLLALGVGALVARKAFLILFGSVMKVIDPLVKVYGFFKKTDGVSKFTTLIAKMKSAFETLALKAMYAKDAIVKAFKSAVNGAKDAVKWVGGKLKAAYDGVAGASKKAAGAIANVSKKLWENTVMAMKNTGAVLKNIGAWIAQKAALVAAKAAQIAQTIATNVAAAAQAALNFVMNLNPITLIVIAIAALVAALIWFFTQTELGKQIWQAFVDFLIAAWNGVVEFFKAAGQIMMDIFKAIGDFFVAVWNGLVDGVKFVFNLIVEAIKFYINIWVTIFKVAIAAIVAVWNGIVAAFKAIGKFISGIWDGVISGFKAGINGFAGFFKTVWSGIKTFFKTFVNGLISMVENFVNFFINGINLIIDALSTLSIKIPDWVPGVGGQTWGIKLAHIPKFKLPRLAAGGVVSPSAGGTIAQIAEAGRPERVEPLDQNGLSKRDKVLIDALSGGAAGGVNITVNPSKGMDEHELAANISRILGFQLRAGGIA